MKRIVRVLNLCLFAILGLGMVANAAPQVRYVKAGATGDGSSWQSASGDLQAMIDASSSGDAVWVAEGIYKPGKLIQEKRKRSYAFILKSGVSLFGGFRGTETDPGERIRLPEKENGIFKYPAILSADDDVPDVWTRKIQDGSTYRYAWEVEGNGGNGNHVLYCAEKMTSPTIIDGFTLKGAMADVWQVQAGGAALYARGQVELRKCVVTENMAQNKVEGKAFFGGAVSLLETDGKAVVEDCLFLNNYVLATNEISSGGAIYNDGGTIRACVFRGCVSLDQGGAVTNVQKGRIENCIFEDCYASAGGAVYNAVEGVVEKSKIYNCRALKGGGIYNQGDVRLCVIAGCYADASEFGDDMGGSGGGIELEKGRLINSAVYNCTAFTGGGVGIKEGEIVNSTIQHCTVRKTGASANIQMPADPQGVRIVSSIDNPDTDAVNFVTPTTFSGWPQDEEQGKAVRAASWMLAKGSAFVDQGEAVAGITPDLDLEGNPRVVGSAIDRGACEYQVPTIPDANIVVTFASIDDEVTIGTGGGKGTSFSIDWGNGVLETYEGAKNITKKPLANEVRIYGDNLLIFKAVKQGITALDLTKAPLIAQLQIGGNLISALDLTKNPALTGLYCESNKLEVLNLSVQTRLRVLDCHDNAIVGDLDCSAMTKLTKLIAATNKLSSVKLPETESLAEVDCGENELSALTLTGLPNLTELSCNDNKLETIDLQANSKLQKVYCPGNKFTVLDLQHNPALVKLMAFDNALTSVNLSANTELTDLYLQHNKLTTLDVTSNKKLGWINIEDNALTAIDLAAQSSLRLLNVGHNKLKALDVKNNPLVNILHAGNNELETLDVSKQAGLVWLTCDSNRLASLDLQANTYISWLEVENNKLSSLRLDKQKELQKLFCGYNLLTSLDLAVNTKLQGLLMEGNRMEADAINAVMDQLPTVDKVEITDNNRSWAKQLNVSYMPGTKDVVKSKAEGKGWTVIAAIDNSVRPIPNPENGLRFDYPASVLRAARPMEHVVVCNAAGQRVRTAEQCRVLDLSDLPAGGYIAIGIDAFGRVHNCKFIRR